VRISCKNDGPRRLIVELTIGLSGRIEPDSDVAAHILAADATDPGCPGGVVDPVGNQ
jgi:ribonuclease T2